jgi:type I restriction enzyme R subunit
MAIAAEGYVIRGEGDHRVDLSKIDFEALKARFATGHKHIEAGRLKGEIGRKLRQMVRANRTRMNYLKKFQEMIDEYNAGSYNIEEFFKKLTAFAQVLNEEDKRAISERLTEEELAIFDLLTKPDVKLTKAEEAQVKKVAQELLEKLKHEKFVLDWRKRQQTRAAVRVAIEEALDELPERPYPRPVYAAKCEAVYQHMYDSYYGENRSVYAAVAG